MKKILVVLLILIVIVIAGFAVFLATFDLNRYNKALASQIESAVGNPVEIGHISLKWNGRLLLAIEKFQILEEENGQTIPELSFEHGDMSLELMPLLRMQLKVSSVSVTRLSIHLVRVKDGAIKFRGYNPKPAASPAATKPSSKLPVVIDFNVGSITIKNSTIRFEDFMVEPAADISIDALDADIKNVSLNGPVQFVVKMALLCSKQNLDISGVAGGFATGPLYVQDLNAGLDIGSIDHAKLLRAVPALRNMGIQDNMAGLLKANVSQLRFAGSKIEKVSANITLDDGKISLSSFKVPIENINLSASVEDDKISVRSFSAQLANATLKNSADISNIFTVPQTVLHLDAGIPSVKEFFSKLVSGKQYLDGATTLSFDGTMSGFSQEAISKTLSGKGTFTLDNGVILDMNLIRQSLGAIAMFPGLVDGLGGFLPAAIKDAMNQQHTLLKPVRQSIIVKDGTVDLPDLDLETDFANVKGAASITLTGELTGNGIISFAQALSDGIIKAVPQMRYLADQNNIIEFPITFKVSSAGASVMPDLQYIGKKVAMQKGREMATDFLKKAVGPEGQAQSGQIPTQNKPAASFNDIIKDAKDLANEMQGTGKNVSQ